MLCTFPDGEGAAFDMELRRLRYFLRIAAEGSLGKASRALNIAQPALGRQIQLLESELGAKLFERVSKGMRLTQEGEYLRQAIEHPLELLHIALGNVRHHSVPMDASLVLGLPPEVALIFGPRILGRMQKELPTLKLRIAECDSARLAADLARGLVDIAILVGIFPAEKVFHFEVMSEQLNLVVPSGSAIANRSSIAFTEIADLPLILPGTHAGLRTKLSKVELTSGVSLNIALEIDSSDLAKQAVRNGLGYAILPPVSFKAEAAGGELIGIPITEPEIEQSVRYAVRPLWPVPRSTYDQVERIIFEEWHLAASSGDWDGRWLFDPDLLAAKLAAAPAP